MEIWKYAKINTYTIVSFDSGFIDIANLKGHPPKVIWLRTGNTTTNGIAEILLKKVGTISAFIENKDNLEIACLEIE